MTKHCFKTPAGTVVVTSQDRPYFESTGNELTDEQLESFNALLDPPGWREVQVLAKFLDKELPPHGR